MSSQQVFTQVNDSNGYGSLAMSTFGRGSSGPGFTYNDNPYVHALNQALQLEQAAVAIYAAKHKNSFLAKSPDPLAFDRTECHFSALRKLVKLIFAQRGLPDSEPAGLMAVTGTVAAKVSRYMPPIVQDPVLGVSAHRVEMALARRYGRLLELAPTSDRAQIHELLKQVKDFSKHS